MMARSLARPTSSCSRVEVGYEQAVVHARHSTEGAAGRVRRARAGPSPARVRRWITRSTKSAMRSLISRAAGGRFGLLRPHVVCGRVRQACPIDRQRRFSLSHHTPAVSAMRSFGLFRLWRSELVHASAVRLLQPSG